MTSSVWNPRGFRRDSGFSRTRTQYPYPLRWYVRVISNSSAAPSARNSQ